MTPPRPARPPATGGPSDRPLDLFVYGTLRRGRAANHLLGGGRLLGEEAIRGSLFDVGGRFPALVLDGWGMVRGERWRIEAARLGELDAYEGVADGLFERVLIEVSRGALWVYAAGPRLRPLLSVEARVPGGEWPPRGL